MYQNTTKYNAADMFLSTTMKHIAAKKQNATKLMIAKHVKNGLQTNIANMFQNISGNISVEQLAAHQHAQHNQLAQTNLVG